MLFAYLKLIVREIMDGIGTWLGGFDFELPLGYEKLINEMGAAFGNVQPKFGRIFAPFNNGARNMHSPQHSGDQAAVETVDLSVNKVIVTVFWNTLRLLPKR